MGRVVVGIASVAVLALLLVSTRGYADKRNPVEKLAADAASAYHGGDYQRAVDLLERAYKLQPVSALLYNLAKAYDKLGESQTASDLYAKYAAADDADPRLKVRAETRLGTLVLPPRKSEPPHKNEPPRPEPPSSTEPPPRAEPPPSTEPPPAATVAPRPTPISADERGRRRDCWVALGVGVGGVALLGTALGLSVSALSLHDQFAATQDETAKRTFRDGAQTQALAADLLYAAGVAAAGVTAYFLYRAFRPAKKLALGPWLAPTGGGLAALGRF